MSFTAIIQNTVFDASVTVPVLRINATGTFVNIGPWKMRFRVTAPSGEVIYANNDFGGDQQSWESPVDISDASLIFATVPLLLDVHDVPVPGLYLVEWEAYNADGGAYAVSEGTYSSTVAFPTPTVEITHDIQIDASQLVSTDLTNYVHNNVTPVNTRVHKITFPLPVDIAPVQNAQQTITVTPIYEGTWRTDIDSTLLYTYSNTKTGSTATITTKAQTRVRGYATVQVIYLSLDDIQEKWFNLNARYEAAQSKGNPAAEPLFYTLTRITQLIAMYNQSMRAGDEARVDLYYNKIVAILGKDNVTTTG